MLTATMRVKELFFDAPAVRRAMDDASHKALSRIGAFLRTRARGSMREAKGPSRPGKPPHAHVGTIKRLLFFSYDRATRSVVVGPVRFGRTEAPRTLEFGGRTRAPNLRRTLRRYRDGGEIAIGLAAGRTTTLARNTLLGTVPVSYTLLRTEAQVRRANELNERLYGPLYRNITVRTRPFMAPALGKEIRKGTIPAAWEHSIRGT